MELVNTSMQPLLKHFSNLPFEQWKASDLPQIISKESYPQELEQKSSYDLLIYLMECSFSLLVEQLEPIIDSELMPSKKIHFLCDAFIQFGSEHPDAYRIAFLIRPQSADRAHLPVESAIRFRVLIRKLFRLLSQEIHSLKQVPLELHVQGLMCLLNGIVVSTLSLQRMVLIEPKKLSEYIVCNYLHGISNRHFPAFLLIDN